MTELKTRPDVRGNRRLITLPDLLMPAPVKAACRTLDRARQELIDAQAEVDASQAALAALDRDRTEQLAQAALAGRRAPDDTERLSEARARVEAAADRLRVARRADELADTAAADVVAQESQAWRAELRSQRDTARVAAADAVRSAASAVAAADHLESVETHLAALAGEPRTKLTPNVRLFPRRLADGTAAADALATLAAELEAPDAPPPPVLEAFQHELDVRREVAAIVPPELAAQAAGGEYRRYNLWISEEVKRRLAAEATTAA